MTVIRPAVCLPTMALVLARRHSELFRRKRVQFSVVCARVPLFAFRARSFVLRADVRRRAAVHAGWLDK